MNIEPGTYRAKCTGTKDAQWGVSKNGNVQLALVFAFAEGELLGQEITWIGTFAPGKATDIAIQAIENCGWDGTDPTESLDGIDKNDVNLVIGLEADQDGKMYPRVQWVNKPGNGRIKFQQPVSAKELKAFSPDIRGAVAMRRQQQGKPVASRPSAQQRERPQQQQQRRTGGGDPGPDDFGPTEYDEIPF
jgi:hypothetical protein